MIGVRKAESTRRSKREEIELSGHKFSGNFDQFSEHKEKMVTCVGGKDKILVSPIIHWTDRDVWQFLNGNSIEHCSLYDEGYKRIGCIICPMSNYKQKLKDCQRFPHAKHKWIQTIQKLIDAGYLNHNFTDAEFGFNWWISDKILTNIMQTKYCNRKLSLTYNDKEMNIDTEFNVGDSVCYLSGDNIIHTSISKIIIEISYADDSFLMVYKLSDGLSVPRNNYPQWGKRLFRDKDSLMRYLSES